MSNEQAWAKQSASLVEVQREAGILETTVTEILKWQGGRVVYDQQHNYDLQVDAVYPDSTKPNRVCLGDI